MHFKANELLEGVEATRRYSFHLVSPKDYALFFERLRNGELDLFVSSLQAALSA